MASNEISWYSHNSLWSNYFSVLYIVLEDQLFYCSLVEARHSGSKTSSFIIDF
jgi:hypothetical protein